MRRSLTKNQIIRTKADIDNTFKAGKRYSLSCFKLFVAKNDLPYSRIIVIPVRHYGNSVQRNRIRRQIKEIFRLNQDKIRSGLDFAFIVYKGKNPSYEEQQKIVMQLLEKSASMAV